MAEKYKTPNFEQRITTPDPHSHTDRIWYRYLEGIENIDLRLTTIEAQSSTNTADILALKTRVSAIEAEQDVQNNRLDGLEIAVFGGAGGTGEFGDGFGAGFAVS